MEKDDTFVLITDGLTEVFDRADRELGADGVQCGVDLVARDGSPAEIERAVFDACRAHGPQLDDQTLLVVRVEE